MTARTVEKNLTPLFRGVSKGGYCLAMDIRGQRCTQYDGFGKQEIC